MAKCLSILSYEIRGGRSVLSLFHSRGDGPRQKKEEEHSSCKHFVIQVKYVILSYAKI